MSGHGEVLAFGNLMRTISAEGELSWEPLREGIDISRIYSTATGASIAFVRFSDADVVRHKLVQKIVNAYKEHAERSGQERPE